MEALSALLTRLRGSGLARAVALWFETYRADEQVIGPRLEGLVKRARRIDADRYTALIQKLGLRK